MRKAVVMNMSEVLRSNSRRVSLSHTRALYLFFYCLFCTPDRVRTVCGLVWRERENKRTNELFFINEGNGISTICFLHPALGEKKTILVNY